MSPTLLPKRAQLTDDLVSSLPFAEPGCRYIVRDAELPGFFVRVGTRTKTYTIQVDVWSDRKRRNGKEVIGRVGRIAADEARAKARSRIDELRGFELPWKRELPAVCAALDRGANAAGWIYFIQAQPCEPIKIGFTRENPRDRLQALQTGSPVRLRIVAVMPGTTDTERAIHSYLKRDRMEGEWFRPSEALSALLCARFFGAAAPSPEVG